MSWSVSLPPRSTPHALKHKWLYNAVLIILPLVKKKIIRLMKLIFFPSSLYSPLRALKQNWLQVLLRVTLWRSAQTPKYASAVAVTETSLSGTFTIRHWYDNSRGTQMAPVVSTFRPTAPNCGLVVWTTRSALGISERYIHHLKNEKNLRFEKIINQ